MTFLACLIERVFLKRSSKIKDRIEKPKISSKFAKILAPNVKDSWLREFVCRTKKVTSRGHILSSLLASLFAHQSGQSLYIQLFRERLSQKLCTRQSRKVIWECSIHCS